MFDCLCRLCYQKTAPQNKKPHLETVHIPLVWGMDKLWSIVQRSTPQRNKLTAHSRMHASPRRYADEKKPDSKGYMLYD